MDEHIIYVGLDVHKETIAVALAAGGRGVIYRSRAAKLRALAREFVGHEASP